MELCGVATSRSGTTERVPAPRRSRTAGWRQPSTATIGRAFPGLDPTVVADIARHATRRRYQRGAAVLTEGESAGEFFVISRGAAEVVQSAGNGDVYLRTMGPDEFFGEIGLVDGGQRTATVRAVGRLSVVVLNQDAFATILSGESGDHIRLALDARRPRSEWTPDAVPLPPWSRLWQRLLKHPRASHYNRLIVGVIAINAVIALAGATWWRSADSALDALSVLAQANIALAVLFRQQAVINLLGRVATGRSVRWPLRVRWVLAKYYHHGGLHVGTSIAGTAWYVAFVSVLLADGDAPAGARVASALVVVLLIVITVSAMPALRVRLHDHFEVTHRFFGWAAILLVWVSTVLLHPSIHVLVTAPAVWLLGLATIGVIWPWLRLRRVRISVERPSNHVALVTLIGEPTPTMGTTRGISRSPLMGWHQFANIPAQSGGDGHRMAISRAGDWTTEFIDSPPERVWVRGVATVELANVRRLFHKVVFVATGSGIAPVLGHLLESGNGSRLVWVTRNPRQTYGDALVDELLAGTPDSLLWDTDLRGKPNVLRLAYGAYLESGAEAVICVSNRAVTFEVVHELERRGIPAFGPIFDS
jgi:hypothetical protein